MTISPSEVFARLMNVARGRSNAIAAPRLAELLAVSYDEGSAGGNGSGRDVRTAVRKAVLAGYPICSGHEGYWVPATSLELRESASMLEERAATLMQRASVLRQAETLLSLAGHPVERIEASA